MKLQRGTSKDATPTVLAGHFVTAWGARKRAGGLAGGAFVLDGAKLSDNELGSPGALLPLFAWHADNLYRYAMGGRGLGLTFHVDDEALLTRRVNLDLIERATSEALLYVLEAVEDIHANMPRSQAIVGAVELRSLVNRFAHDFQIGPAAAFDPAAGANAKPQ